MSDSPSSPEELSSQIKRAMRMRDQADHRYRASIAAAVYGGMTAEQIAEVVGVSRSAITMYCHRHGIRKSAQAS